MGLVTGDDPQAEAVLPRRCAEHIAVGIKLVRVVDHRVIRRQRNAAGS